VITLSRKVFLFGQLIREIITNSIQGYALAIPKNTPEDVFQQCFEQRKLL